MSAETFTSKESVIRKCVDDFFLPPKKKRCPTGPVVIKGANGKFKCKIHVVDGIVAPTGGLKKEQGKGFLTKKDFFDDSKPFTVNVT
eukprot:UN01501